MVEPSRNIDRRGANAKFVFLWGMAIATSVVLFAAKELRNKKNETVSRAKPKLQEQYQEYSYVQIHMAMPVRISVFAQDEAQSKEACRAAFKRISELVLVFSDYDPASEVSQLVATNKRSPKQPQKVSEELLTVLLYAKKLHVLSGGAFDPTARPNIVLWRRARKNKTLPMPAEIESARSRTGFARVELNEQQSTVKLPPDASLDFGAIAKGFIGDEVLRLLHHHGIESACIEAGGDFVLGNAPPGQPGWEIDVPFQGKRVLANCAISVSGDTSQFVEIDGNRFSHVVDPRTGRATSNRRMSVVIAGSGICSDALATVGCILERPAFNELIDQFSNVKAWQYTVNSENEDSL